ncbi:hypothetical protein CcrMagneto_gp214 [Caulobacter virus Magneto]|uniref:hypothetical protein n=1 Tax=Caulobacter virus Magneto TaxID=1211642 RepID=UPI00028B6A06|nr:hypothetical protein CcrMagneto_gp214 [Caulobacter virus Magneto]AFU87384.1 hypothetical protein CcrMagneto_gp214 [Caulobacter virus Magneto]
MIQTFSDHLRDAARVYYERDAKQRTAWDVLAAKKWGDICMNWAALLEGKSIQDGCAYLISLRDGGKERADDEAWAMIVGANIYREITILVDPFVKDRRGWIAQDLSKNDLAFVDHHGDGRPTQHGEAPEAYTRYIGTNQPVAHLRKGRENGRGLFGWDHDEDPAAWAARKAAWFARYAEDLPVVDNRDRHTPGEAYAYFHVIGRAGDFAKGT